MSITRLTKIRWNPLDIDIFYGPFGEDDQFGSYSSFPKPTITLEKTLDGVVYFSTLVHELIEFINDVYGIKLKEKDIRILEISILQLISSNPELLDIAKALFKFDLRHSSSEGSVDTPES